MKIYILYKIKTIKKYISSRKLKYSQQAYYVIFTGLRPKKQKSSYLHNETHSELIKALKVQSLVFTGCFAAQDRQHFSKGKHRCISLRRIDYVTVLECCHF